MDPKEAELGVAAWLRTPKMHDEMCSLWTRYLAGELQPTERELTMLDIWLRTDDAGHLHDNVQSRYAADNSHG